jgi:hypothetical protein
MPYVDTNAIAAVNQLLAGVPAPQVNFKGRIALRQAHQEVAPGATQINQQPTLFAAVGARAIVDLSNR